MLDEKDLQAIAGLVNQSANQSKNRMKTCINQSEGRMKTYIESNVEKKIQLLYEGHEAILGRLPEADEQEQLKSRVKVLERVVTDMRVEIDELKKA